MDDRAVWIREQFQWHFAKLDGLGLDFYHMSESVHRARRKVFGEESLESNAWNAPRTATGVGPTSPPRQRRWSRSRASEPHACAAKPPKSRAPSVLVPQERLKANRAVVSCLFWGECHVS